MGWNVKCYEGSQELRNVWPIMLRNILVIMEFNSVSVVKYYETDTKPVRGRS